MATALERWLGSLKLSRYHSAFVSHSFLLPVSEAVPWLVSGAVVRHRAHPTLCFCFQDQIAAITSEDLDAIGITLLGHRKRILNNTHTILDIARTEDKPSSTERYADPVSEKKCRALETIFTL